MAIQVVCPNGHVLKVTDESAGKTGLCPVCKARVKVPKKQEGFSEDAILDLLADSEEQRKKQPLQTADLDPEHQRKVARGGETRSAPPKKTCPRCNTAIPGDIRICPNCRTYVAGMDGL